MTKTEGFASLYFPSPKGSPEGEKKNKKNTKTTSLVPISADNVPKRPKSSRQGWRQPPVAKKSGSPLPTPSQHPKKKQNGVKGGGGEAYLLRPRAASPRSRQGRRRRAAARGSAPSCSKPSRSGRRRGARGVALGPKAPREEAEKRRQHRCGAMLSRAGV